MELATQALNDKPRDAYYWRLFATAASFALFGFGGLCLRLLVFPLLSCLPGTLQNIAAAPAIRSVGCSGSLSA